MIRRRYRIEASTATLKRFIDTLASHERGASFVQRVSCNTGEEYYYVVCFTEREVHVALEAQRFTDSIIYH